MKAHVGLSKQTKQEIEKYYREYAESYARQQLKVFLMLVCEAMIIEYGFGPKRLPEFYEKVVSHMGEFSGLYDDSVEFAARKRLYDLGFDFDGEWEKWEAKYRQNSEAEG